jgi:microcystin degradation protein MlrC
VRLAYGMFRQESNSLAVKPSSLQSFRDVLLAEGKEIAPRRRGTGTEIGGVLAAGDELGIELVPTIAALSVASAPVTRDAFEYIADRILSGIADAGPLDGVVLILHGAAVVDGIDDGTGELLRRVRALVGPDLPVTGTLDLHANLTSLMADCADVLFAYHTYPHIDAVQVARRAVELAVAQARREIHPVHALRRLPMILPAENSATTHGPMAEVMAHAEEIERRPGVLAVSVCPTQPWLNLPDMACSVLVVADRDQALADACADELARHFWRVRERFYDLELVPPREAVRRSLAAARGPIVLSDGADGTGSGASGDSTAILEALLQERATDTKAFLSIVDPEAVRICIAAGVGATVSLPVGGGIDRIHYRPLEVTGRVRLISDGEYIYKGPQFTGDRAERGRTAVLAIGEISVVLHERTAFNWDPEFYRSLGLEPADARMVVVKSPTAYRAAYAGLMADSIIVDAPGAARANIRALESEMGRVQRPIVPFDEVPDEFALGPACR